jgi:hypothetical protein
VPISSDVPRFHTQSITGKHPTPEQQQQQRSNAFKQQLI